MAENQYGAVRLIVKGDRDQATKAAKAHGVTFAFVSEIRKPPPTITIGLAPLACFEAVVAWFNEAPAADAFPVGTLFHWQRTQDAFMARLHTTGESV